MVKCGVNHLRVDVSDYDISRGRLCAASLSIASYVWYKVVTASNMPVPDPIVPVISAKILSDAMRTAPDTEAMKMRSAYRAYAMHYVSSNKICQPSQCRPGPYHP